jgi:hypothetical protein
MPKPYYRKEGLTISGICGKKVWRFGDRWFGPRDYDAFYKNALYSTILHFTPLLDYLIK